MSQSLRQESPAFDRTRHASIAVEVSNTQGHLDIDPQGIVGLVQGVLGDEGVEQASISVVLVDNATIRRINQKHLGHDWPTDVISFTLSTPGEPEFAGELVVSAEMACAAAAELGTDALAEVALYLIHGLLHLRGYDDALDSEIRIMRARELVHLSAHKITGPGRAADLAPAGQNEEESPTWSG